MGQHECQGRVDNSEKIFPQMIVVELNDGPVERVERESEEIHHPPAVLWNLDHGKHSKVYDAQHEYPVSVVLDKEALLGFFPLTLDLREAEDEEVADEPVYGIVGAESACQLVDDRYDDCSVDDY